MRSPNPRFCLIKSKLTNSNIIYDKLTEDASVEIATNSSYHNTLMGKACLLILGDAKFRKMVEDYDS